LTFTPHPPVDRDVVNLDAAFGKEFFDIAIRQAVAEVPAHGEQDHLWRKPAAGKRSGPSKAAAIHSHTLVGPHPIRQRNGARHHRRTFLDLNTIP